MAVDHGRVERPAGPHGEHSPLKTFGKICDLFVADHICLFVHNLQRRQRDGLRAIQRDLLAAELGAECVMLRTWES